MNKLIIWFLLSLFSLWILVSCAAETICYAKAHDKGTKEAYLNYIQKYPDKNKERVKYFQDKIAAMDAEDAEKLAKLNEVKEATNSWKSIHDNSSLNTVMAYLLGIKASQTKVEEYLGKPDSTSTTNNGSIAWHYKSNTSNYKNEVTNIMTFDPTTLKANGLFFSYKKN